MSSSRSVFLKNMLRMGIPKQNRELKYILKDTQNFVNLLDKIKKIREVQQANDYQETYLRR